MKSKKGFSLIEILAVIIILGIIMIITIPAVTKYILSSNKSSYAADIQAFAETMKGEYDMKDYGSYVKQNEIMIIPLNLINLEKGNNTESPFGSYDFDKCYGVVAPEKNGYELYMTVIDDNGMGVILKKHSELTKDAIEDGIGSSVNPWSSYLSTSNKFSFDNTTFYSFCEERIVKKDQMTGAKVVILCKE